ncbi:hypothetical protein Sjap_008698 [Stephania japonica]|uniref:Protein kinase domain-containing protein n=1 Tax=Stephania japonica TaxID=461633 RepID=A0AAP0JQH7_9MAGN
MEVKLSDLGLAKMLDSEDQPTVSVEHSYMDPEYMTTAKLTAATGIYRFGIVILQVLTGRGVVNLGFHARDQLIQMAKDVVKGKGGLLDFMDPQLLKHEELLIFDCKLL